MLCPDSRRKWLWSGLALLACIGVLMAPTGGCRRAPKELRVHRDPGHPGRYFTAFEAMGTDVRVVVLASDRTQAVRWLTTVPPVVGRVERQMSTYRSDSEISRLNAAEPGEDVELSPSTRQVLKAAKKYARLSGGAFDVTYAPLRELWRRAQQNGTPPSFEEVEEVLRRVGSHKLVLGGSTAHLATDGMQVDLGGIAKGYAIDRAVEALREAGARNALVDIGGDIRLLGHRDGGEKWKVKVRDPRRAEHGPIYLRVADVAVATSGDYARFFRLDGRKYSHIIDPRTGRPVQHAPSVTVVAPKALQADALATAASVMKPDEALGLIDSLPVAECLIMYRSANGGVRLHYSSGFRALMERKSGSGEVQVSQ